MSIIFGRGRFNAGVLIEPKEQFKFDPIDQAKLAEFRNKIWYVPSYAACCGVLTSYRPTMEKVNHYAPAHSRIFTEVDPFNGLSML